MANNKLFLVEFGEPQQNNMFSFGGSSMKPIYVVASDYNAASVKANLYLEHYLETNPEAKSILDGDGSLKQNMNNSVDIQIISVKLLSNEIIY